jgi:hypothetical protein
MLNKIVIKIIKATGKKWYSEYIGKEFEVQYNPNEDNDWYTITDEYTIRRLRKELHDCGELTWAYAILKNDCEIVFE